MQTTIPQAIVNPNLLEMEYAVRGPIPQRAAELKKQGRTIISCNIGNPQALGQKPISYYRQILSLVEDPDRIERERKINSLLTNLGTSTYNLFSEEMLQMAEKLLALMETGMGAYTESRGPGFIREAIARFIDRRDGGTSPASDADKIFLTNGASDAVRAILEMLISGPRDGIMIPIPQYPLYSATIKRYGGIEVDYFPDEDDDWNLERAMLDESIQTARKRGVNIRAIVVINPGNPTGAILSERSMRDVIEFAAVNDLAIIADEVYQENVYDGQFTSFAKILGGQPLPLFSLHSISKGFYGECGHRGGYMELRNAPTVKGKGISLIDAMVKQASVSLCSNTVGQALTYLMVSPPTEGSSLYATFTAEKNQVLRDLYEKATRIKEAFTHMEGMKCFGRIGALYLFPRMEKLPAGKDDFDYCMKLLDETGLCTVNGSGFGQKEGTHHLRIAFLPPKELLEEVLPQWIAFHNRYVS